MKFLISFAFLFLIIPLVNASEEPVTKSAVGTELSSEPIRQAFQAQLLANEWDEPAKPKRKPSVASNGTLTESPDMVGKSRTKAIALSFLLPGAGEYYMGQKQKATYFFVAEAINIIGFATFQIAAKWKQDDMIRYGAAHAGASMEGKPDEFYDMMGFYENNEHYNTEGRVGDPWRPYYPDNDEYHWQWQSEQELAAFREIKDKQGQLTQRSKFMLGMAVLNRVISVIDTAISSRKLKRTASGEFAEEPKPYFEFTLNPTSLNRQVALTWHTSVF